MHCDYTILDMSAICPSDLPFVSWLRIVCGTVSSRAFIVSTFPFNLSDPSEISKPSSRDSFAVHLWSHVGSISRERKGIPYVSIRYAVYNPQQCSRLVGKVHNLSGPLNSTGTPESLLLGKEPTIAFSVDRRVSDSTPKCVSP
jgi:hypothetical protein